MSSDITTKWIQSVLVPHILKKDRFKGAIVTKTEVKALETMKDNFASEMYETNLLLNHHGENKNVSFILKVMCEDEAMRTQLQSDKLFLNEIHFYSTVKPLLSSHISQPQLKSDFENLFPVCFYSHYNKEKIPESFEDAVVVMENLKVDGFQLGNRTSLDFEHLTVAVKSLGLYHAFSYYLKERDFDTFMNVIKPIHEVHYSSQNEFLSNHGGRIQQERVMDALAKERPEGDSGLERLRELASRKPFEVFTDLVQPREPLAVLCHGDFLRNNVLFRYEDGKPADIKFVDFQTIRYASPVIDLSVMLCMNSTHELRMKHFDELLKIYHTSMKNTLAALLEKPTDQLEPCYSFEAFLAEFRSHALYGFKVAIMFLPVMFASFDDLRKMSEMSWVDLILPENEDFTRGIGGDNATLALTTLAEDLLERQCL